MTTELGLLLAISASSSLLMRSMTVREGLGVLGTMMTSSYETTPSSTPFSLFTRFRICSSEAVEEVAIDVV